VFRTGRAGETYNIGGQWEKTNMEVAHAVCAALDEARPRAEGAYADLIAFVADRAGHDRRYAVDTAKIGAELGWKPAESFRSGLAKTVGWYLENAA
jgi:dTDP-glucose 4,6-dehydratase